MRGVYGDQAGGDAYQNNADGIRDLNQNGGQGGDTKSGGPGSERHPFRFSDGQHGRGFGPVQWRSRWKRWWIWWRRSAETLGTIARLLIRRDERSGWQLEQEPLVISEEAEQVTVLILAVTLPCPTDLRLWVPLEKMVPRTTATLIVGLGTMVAAGPAHESGSGVSWKNLGQGLRRLKHLTEKLPASSFPPPARNKGGRAA